MSTKTRHELGWGDGKGLQVSGERVCEREREHGGETESMVEREREQTKQHKTGNCTLKL